MSMDTLAMPKDAPHPDEGLKFIDFLLRPDVAARNTSITHFANGDITSRDFVDKEVLANKSVYPDQATMARLFTVTGYDQAIQKIVTREWTRVKTGK